MLRRTFLQTVPAAAVAMTAASAEEVPVKLGFDTYSLRAFRWTGTQLLDYAAGLKLDTIQFSALGDYGPLDAPNLQEPACVFGLSRSMSRSTHSLCGDT